MKGEKKNLRLWVCLHVLVYTDIKINTSPRLVVLAVGLLAAGVWVVRWASEKK